MTPPGPILVVNPNSDEAVTRALSLAVEPFRSAGGPAIECLTIAESPIGIMTQRDVEEAGLRVADLAASRPDASAIVIACYSQPGLDLLRSETGCPVIGMQDAGILTAMAVADRFGVIAVASGSIPRHLRHIARMGVLDRLAGETAPETVLTVAECGDAAKSFEPLRAAGERLKAMGAGAIVLGCAGMSPQRSTLEAALGVPVIDATQAAVSLALTRVLGSRLKSADDPQVSLSLLEIFGAMMRCATTVEAAEQLGISQPAVSNGLRQLERELGVTLFERVHRRLEPTAEAVSLHEELRPMFGVLRGFMLRARDIRQGKSGRIRIVATPPIGHTLAPRAVRELVQDRPEVSISYDVRRLDDVCTAVKEGSADVGIALALDRHIDLNIEILHRTHMVALVPADSILAGQAEVTAQDLAAQPFVGLEAASRLGQLVRSAFDRDHATYDPRVEARYCSTAAVLAQAGLGVAIVDPYTAEFHGEQGLVRKPFNPPCEISVALLLRKGVPRTRLVHSFIEELRRQVRSCSA